MKTLGKVAAVIAVLLAFAFAKGFGKFAGKATLDSYNQSKVEGTIEKTLLETSRQINAQLPTMVDKETRLDTTMCLGKQLHYKYTMINFSEKDIDKAAFKNEITSMLVKNQCNNDSMVKMLRLGVEYYYMYFDRNGSLIAAISISKNNCGSESQQVKLTPVDYDPFASNQPATTAQMKPQQVTSNGMLKFGGFVLDVSEEIKATWPAVKLHVEDKVAKSSKDYIVAIDSDLEIPNTRVKVKVLAFLPDYRYDGKSISTSASNKPNNPAALIVIREPGEADWTGFIYSLHPGIHPYQHDKIAVTLTDGVMK